MAGTSTEKIVSMYEEADKLQTQAATYLARAKAAEAAARQERRHANDAVARAKELRLIAAGLAMERSGVDIDRREDVLASIEDEAKPIEDETQPPAPSYEPQP